MKPSVHIQGLPALELLEQAWHLMRRASFTAWVSYYVGTLPFVLALLFFVADMSRSAFAADRLPAAALGLSLLFIWMKCWQSVFAATLLDSLSGQPDQGWNATRLWRLTVTQGFLQPFGFLLMPIALIILLPAGWVFAFFASATVLGSGQSRSFMPLYRRIWKQMRLWPRQNHIVLLAYKLLFLFVCLNLGVAVLVLPMLFKMLLGIETVFSQSPWSMFNTTLFSSLIGLGYICLDPFIKATYVLRCFYGESLQSGLDLRAELKSYRLSAARSLGILAVGILCFGGVVSTAAPAADAPLNPDPAPAHESELSSERLDRSISDVIERREYTWRLPRQGMKPDSDSDSMLNSWLVSLSRSIQRFFDSVADFTRKILNWILPNRSTNWQRTGAGYDWLSGMRGLLMILLLALVVALGLLVYRAYKQRRVVAVPSGPKQSPSPPPSLRDEGVSADQLPEDEWLAMAGEQMSQGEFRLALRALYLASLAHLARRQLITLARFKSNLDYERELNRRAHALPDLVPLFQENVGTFERVWYGLHEVNQQSVSRFSNNVDSIMKHA